MSTAFTTIEGAEKNPQSGHPANMPMICCDLKLFHENMNRLPFEVTHRLAGDPLFELPRLVELAHEVASRKNPHRRFGDAYSLIGRPEPGHKPLEAAKFDSVDDTIRQIEDANGWIVLHHIERNPAYQSVLETSICDILQLGGKELKKQIKWFEAILFITSPGRATSYHVDRECAWLLQLRGEKEIHLFSRADKEVVPHEELERFWAVDNSAGTYKPQYESRALVYHLKPGNGVHIPVNTPHWLKNGDNISVSMNLNFVFHDRLWGNIYKTNHQLRKRGIVPRPPGENAVVDAFKGAAYTLVQRSSALLEGKPYIPETALEQNKRVFKLMEGRW